MSTSTPHPHPHPHPTPTRTTTPNPTHSIFFNLRQILVGLLLGIGIGLTLLRISKATIPLMNHHINISDLLINNNNRHDQTSDFTHRRHSKSMNSDDHLTWLSWHQVQLKTPFVPNHDPNNLGIPTPNDLINRRPIKSKFKKLGEPTEPEHQKMKIKLPETFHNHRVVDHSDEL